MLGFEIYVWFMAIVFFVIFIAVVYYSSEHYEIAVVFTALSPFISAFFIPNSPVADVQSGPTLGSYLRVAIVLTFGLVGYIKYFQTWPVHRGKISVQLAILILTISLAIASITYSIDPQATTNAVITFLGMLGFLLGLSNWMTDYLKLNKMMNALYIGIAILIVCNFLSIGLLPGRAWWWKTANRLLALWDHPNSLGGFCVLSFPVVLWKYANSEFNQKLFNIFLMFALSLMLLLSGSRTSMATTVLVITLWFLSQKKMVKLMLWIGVISFAMFVFIQVKPSSIERSQGKSVTDLTDREDFWIAATTLIMEKPIFGYGYAVGGKIWEDPRFYDPDLSLWAGNSRTSLHNGYITIATGIGISGFILWILLLFYPLKNFRKIKIGGAEAFSFSVMIVILIINFVESAIGAGGSMTSQFFWLTWLMAGKFPQLQNSQVLQNG